jgi:hypothetical protein
MRKLAANPGDHQAAAELVEIIKRNRAWNDDGARKLQFFDTGGWSIRRRSPKGASFPCRLFLEGGGNSRPGPVLLRHPRATFGADDGSRTRMAEGRGILSPLRLPVSPRPLAAMGFNGASTGRQAPFGAARGKAD